MSPELKFHSIIISITTLIMFTIWIKVTSFIVAYPLLSVFLAGIFSLGVYRFLTTIFLSLFRNIIFIKKFILGSSYMEGTWVGFFVGHQNKIKYIVETFEQNLTELKIRGNMYNNKILHGSYISHDVTIDIKNGTISYLYDADVMTNTHNNPGLAKFNFERPNKESPPNRLTGYSSDLFSPTKLIAFEEKISDKTTIEISDALEKSIEIYNKYKVNIKE